MWKVASTLLLLAISGCGYQFQGGGSILPPDVKNIQIPIVQNNTAETKLTVIMTEALRDRFERFGVVSVVDEAALADAVLKARIIDVKKETRNVTSNTDTALQYDLIVTMAAELKRNNGAVLYRNMNLRVVRSVGSTSGVVVTSSADFAQGRVGSSTLEDLGSRELSRGQEQEAYVQLAENAAKQLYDEAVAPDF